MKKLLLLSLIIFTILTNSYATHVKGGEITYTHVSGDVYEVTLKAYRGCADNYAMSTTGARVYFKSASCNQDFYQTLLFVDSSEVSPLCPGQLSNCNGGTLPGTEEYVYRGLVTLPPCSDWIICWASLARNASITNLVDPDQKDVYMQNTLNNIVGTDNSSAQYLNSPMPYMCANQLTIYSHGATDPDGDSLYYAFNQPRENIQQNPPTWGVPYPPGVPIAFSPGYTLLEPMITASGMNLNQLTGDMCFTPSQVQIAVVSMLISEFRNGVLIATQMREMQVVVSATCSNNNPTIGNVAPLCGVAPGGVTILPSSGPSVTMSGNSVTMCPNETVCLEITMSDPEINNITVLDNITAALPGATWNVVGDGTPNPVGILCWTPTVLDSGLNVFNLILNDDGCPNVGTQTFTYNITVHDAPYAGPDDTICTNESVQLNASVNGTWYVVGSSTPIVPGPAFTCNPCSNPVITGPPGTTEYYIEGSSVMSCLSTDTISITVTNDFVTPPVLTDEIFCEGSFVYIDAGGGYVSYEWIPSGDDNQSVILTSPGAVAVIVSDGLCTDTSNVITVTEHQNPNPEILGDTVVCSGQNSTTLSFGPGYSNPVWNTGSTADSITVASNVGTIFLTVDSAGCSGTTSVQITTGITPFTTIDGAATICPGETVNLSASGGPFDGYLWNPTNSTSSTTSAGPGPISVTITKDGCEFTASGTIFSYPAPTADFTISPEAPGAAGMDITFTDASSGASSWVWNFDVTNIGGNPSTETGNGPIIFVYDNAGTYTVSFTVTDDNGCKNTITKEYLISNNMKLPNVFSPNGDGTNDYLVFEGLDPALFPNNLTVFNRWGRKVFEQSNYSNDWSPEDLSEGTYFYVLKVDYSKEQKVFKGSLSLLRAN